jgi:uncharacterized protein YtpQ (UPF0354 family)
VLAAIGRCFTDIEMRPSSSPAQAQTREAFERELAKRRLAFTIDPDSGRYRLKLEGFDTLISIENLQRDVASDGDWSRIARFVDTVIASVTPEAKPIDVSRLFWCLEPNDHQDKADYRAAVSDRVDRILVHLSADGTRITWITPQMLETTALSADAAGAIAFENLAREMKAAKVEFTEKDGVRLGYLNTTLPFKASLILAPNLKPCIETTLGWPVMAVAPDRDFLYLWASRHETFVNRLGHVVVEQNAKASYPLSTEVYAIADDQIKAIGEFPSQPRKKP